MKKIFSFVILFFCIFSYGAVTVTVNGSNYSIPQTNERGWGTAVTNWIQAISSNTLQPVGGSFTLTNDVDFGASYGLKSSYILSRNSNPATAGLLRLNVTDYIGWRNNANSGNLLLAVNASDKLTFNGSVVATVPLARSDLGSGTANHVIINDGSGVLSSEAQLAKSRGGTGADNSSVTFPSSGTIATQAGVEVLTNKDIDGGTASNTSRITVPKDTLTNLQSLTRKQGTLVFDTTSNKPYYDDGTNLKVIGSGSGGTTNLIDDGDAEAGTSNYVEGSYSAATRPSGTFTPSSGAGAFAISTTTSSPLFGNTSFLLTKSSGASRQGRAVERTITIPSGYRTKMLKTRIDYTIVSGSFVAGSNGSSPTDSSLIWYVGQYNGSTWTYHEPSTFKMFSSSTTNPDYVEGEFQVNSDTTQIKLIAYVAETANSAWVVKCEVGIKESTIAAGTTVTDWVSYTPTITGFGSPTSTTYKYRRVGDSAEINFNFTSGTNTGVAASISLPSGLTLDNSKVSSNIVVGKLSASATPYSGGFTTSTSAPTLVYFTSDGGDYTYGAVGTTWANSTMFGGSFSVPITGWSSSTQVSDGYDGRLIAAKYYLASNTAFSTGTVQVPYDTKVYDTTNSYSTSTFKYTAPSSGWYRATITFNTTASLTETVAYRIDATTSYYLGTSGSTGRFNGTDTFYLNAGQTFEPMSAGSGGTYAGGATNSFFTIEKLSSPQTMSATEVVAARYTTINNQAFTGAATTIVNYEVKTHSTHDSVTTGSGAWNFKAPVSGFYKVQASIRAQAKNYSTGDNMVLYVYKNGAEYSWLGNWTAHTNLTSFPAYMGDSDTVQLNAGETLDVRVFTNTTINLDNNSGRSHINIERIK